jgi:hypothetical protein
MEPNYENSTAAAKGCYWNERPFSNENERNTHNSTLPDINLLSTKNGLDFGVHLISLRAAGRPSPFERGFERDLVTTFEPELSDHLGSSCTLPGSATTRIFSRLEATWKEPGLYSFGPSPHLKTRRLVR